MCIYLGNDSKLTYKSQEHIFLATVGGILKLPDKYVSDQINSYFSSLESNLVTQSVFGLEKMFYGPGNRGKDKPGRMPINLLITEEDEELGFTFKGKPTPIPQIKINKNVSKISISRDYYYQTDDDFKNLIQQVEKFNKSTKYILLELNLEKNDFIISLYDKNIYIATKNKELILNDINFIRNNISNKINIDNMKKEKELINVKNLIDMSINNRTMAIIFAKTAFNTLAHIRGKEYVMNTIFDDFRNQIIGKSNIRFLFIPKVFKISDYANVNDKAHFCLLQNVYNKFCAIVSFYNDFWLGFEICNRFDNDFNKPFLYICDWNNKKEYSLKDELYYKNFE